MSRATPAVKKSKSAKGTEYGGKWQSGLFFLVREGLPAEVRFSRPAPEWNEDAASAKALQCGPVPGRL